jgi:uncharacterized protein
MALVRILIDGYNLINALCELKQILGSNQSYRLLHNWLELAPGQPRYSERARNELIHILTKYHDATGEPITIFFDGAGAPAFAPKPDSSREVEILFSRAGQTADDMIERAAHRFQSYGEVLVVTDDIAERDTVGGLGGSVASCANFIRMVESALTELQDELRNYNRTERNRFKRPQ